MTNRQCLIVRGGWDGHVPEAATDLFVPFLESNGFDIRIETDPEVYADAAVMGNTDLVVQCFTMGRLSKDGSTGLSDAIAAGTGMAGWHGGIMDSYRENSDYLHLIGAQFACHPGKLAEHREGGPEDNFVTYEIEMSDVADEHPITAGLDDFTITTEQYWILVDDYLDVLASTTHPVKRGDRWHREVVSPAVFTRRWGNGRIAAVTPGHDLATLMVPTVRTLVERSMLWAAR